MKQFVTDNPTAVTLVVVAVLFLATSLGMQGCDLTQAINVSVPQGIQGAMNVPGQVTLADAQLIYDNFIVWSKGQADSFGENIAQGWRWFGFFKGAMDMGLAQAGALGIGALPIGGIALSALTYAAGLLTKKPGTDKWVATEKEASFNKGMEEGRRNGNHEDDDED